MHASSGISQDPLIGFFLQFRKMAARRGTQLVFPTADSLLSSKASYWVEGDVLRFALQVPIVISDAKMLTAYRIESGWYIDVYERKS